MLILFTFMLAVTLIAMAADERTYSHISMAIVILLGLWWLKLYLYDIKRAGRESAKQGFEVIILLPLFVRWAKYLTGKQFKNQQITNAYEIHIRRDKLPSSPKQFLINLENDLDRLAHNMRGLFLWETSITVPYRIRARIKGYEEAGFAYWLAGGWPVPRMPHMPKFKKTAKKPLRRGAILIIGGVINNC